MGGGLGDGGDCHVHIAGRGGGEPLVETGVVHGDGYGRGPGFRLLSRFCCRRFHDVLHDRRRRDHRPTVGHVRPTWALREEAVVQEVRHGVRGYVDRAAPGGWGGLGGRGWGSGRPPGVVERGRGGRGPGAPGAG